MTTTTITNPVTAPEYIVACSTGTRRGNPFGQRVRVIGTGYGFTRDMCGRVGTIVRVNRAGNPVIHIDLPNDTRGYVEISDKHGNTALVDNDGKYVRDLGPLAD